MPPKTLKDKMEAEVRKIARLDGNKMCADCTERMPGYVNTTHSIFVCTRCSGIHRELQYKIKGISMSEFSKDDVAALAAAGNNVHNAKYLARHTPRDHHPIPNGSDVNKLRDFIKMKYVDKRWYSDDGAPPAAQASHQSAPVPAPQSHSGAPASPAEIASQFDPFSSAAAPAPAPHAPAASSGFGDFDPFGSHSTPQVAPAPMTHAPPAASGFGDFDPFGSSEHSHSTPQPAGRPAPSNDWDAFGGSPAPAPAAPPATSNQWDAFGSVPAPLVPPPAHGTSVSNHGHGSGSFDPFGSAPAPPVPAPTQGFPQTDHYGQHPQHAPAPALSPPVQGHPAPGQAPQSHMPPMPFVKLHRDADPPPAAAQEPGLSGFSAFDALSVDSASTPVQGGSVSDANPFGAPAHHEQPQPSNGYPQQQPGGYYPQQQPQQQQYGYGGQPQQPQGGYPPAGYPGGPGGGYPPAANSGGYNGFQGGGYGYAQQQQNGQYGGYPQGGQYPPQQGAPVQHAPAGYGYPPQGGSGQLPHEAPAPAAAVADPFADMATGAWNASGGKKQRGSVTSAAPAPNPFSAGPAPVLQAQAPPASANPFDLF